MGSGYTKSRRSPAHKKGLAMFDNINLYDTRVLIGALALIVIVGLWYILLRKRARPEEEENPPKNMGR